MIRDLAARFIAGESPFACEIARCRKCRTVDGGPWRTSTIRAVLCSGRIAGVAEHRGEAIGKACWDAIISDQDRRRILGRMAQQKGSGRRTPAPVPPIRPAQGGNARTPSSVRPELRVQIAASADTCLPFRARPPGVWAAHRGRGAA